MKRKYGFLASLDFASWDAARVVECLAGLGYQAVEWPSRNWMSISRASASIAQVAKVSGNRSILS